MTTLPPRMNKGMFADKRYELSAEEYAAQKAADDEDDAAELKR